MEHSNEKKSIKVHISISPMIGRWVAAQSKNIIIMRFFIFMFLTALVFSASAQKNNVWWRLSDSTFSVIDGQGWPKEMRDSIQRFPSRLRPLVSKSVWEQSRQSAGLSIRFVSNAPEIIVRYKVSGPVAKSNMPLTGTSGVDLYAIDSDGLMHWASANYSITDSVQFTFSQLRPNDNFHKLGREYQLFLPLFNTIDHLEIGVPEGSLFKALPKRIEKPIVVFGSSIVQGESATRPGMAWTNILSRKLDRSVVNLGFSEKPLLDKGMINLINEIDARIFVFDVMLDFANSTMDSSELSKSIIEAIKTIREKHPRTPILFTEHAGYTDGYLKSNRQTLGEDANKLLNETFKELINENISGLYLLTKQEIGMQLDEMSDGEHPNDLGMMRYAEAYEKKLRELFKEPVGKLKTQIPIRQRRTPANFDWEARHYSIIALNKTEPSKILLIGNSITHNWGGKPNARSTESWQKYLAPYDVRNFGFGADRIENVLWRIYHDELDGITPEKIVINIGTNNLRVNSNEEILEGLRFLVQVIKVHQPQAEIAILAIYPRRDYEDRIVAVNKDIRKMTKSEKVGFADISKSFLKEDGKINEVFFNDGLHPKPIGYEVLGKQLEMIIKK
jgi:lysophospholipase L1-like esterase